MFKIKITKKSKPYIGRIFVTIKGVEFVIFDQRDMHDPDNYLIKEIGNDATTGFPYSLELILKSIKEGHYSWKD